MSEIERAISEAGRRSAELTNRLNEIFCEAYGVAKTEDGKDAVGYQAWALLGVDVAIRMAKMFLAIKNNAGVYDVVCDLTYQLSTNEFWQKNANVIMPAIHVALNAHRDGVLLLAERANRNEYSSSDALISAARAAPLEIFPLIGYLIGGPTLQLESSLKLKHELSPYFLS